MDKIPPSLIIDSTKIKGNRPPNTVLMFATVGC